MVLAATSALAVVGSIIGKITVVSHSLRTALSRNVFKNQRWEPTFRRTVRPTAVGT